MKNSNRRLLSIALVLILILSTTVFSGCYQVNSGKMSDIEGTYELTNYSGKSNYLEEKERKLVMVIRADGTGYYGYSDNTTDAFISELRCRYTADTEKSGHYSYVEIDFTGRGEYTKFAVNVRGKNLNSSTPKYKGNLFEGNLAFDYYLNIDFTKIDDSTDRNVIDNEFKGAPFYPYGLKKFNGTYEALGFLGTTPNTPSDAVIPESPFVYFFIQLDLNVGKARAWYMLKEDEVAHDDVLFNASIEKNSDGIYYIKLNSTNTTVDTVTTGITIPYNTESGQFAINMGYVGTLTKEDIEIRASNEYSYYLDNKPITE